jgi:hypothetical protein
MRSLTVLIGALLVTLMSTKVLAAEARRPSGSHTCTVNSGWVKATGHGRTHLEALESARLTCGSMMVDHALSTRPNISKDQEDDLVLACVNLECE